MSREYSNEGHFFVDRVPHDGEPLDEAHEELTIRLPVELQNRLSHYEQYLQSINPGVTVSRGAAIRALLWRALLQFEESRTQEPGKERLHRKPPGGGYIPY